MRLNRHHAASKSIAGNCLGLRWTGDGPNDRQGSGRGGTPHPTPSARSIHPGSSRRKTREYPKGRQVDPQALAEVRALLGDRSRTPDLLIEHLHLLQDIYHCLHARHLVALADELALALTEVYEVASFYAHFDVVMDGEPAPPPITVRVCVSLSCAMADAERLLADLPGVLGTNVRVVPAPCMGGCHRAPMTAIGHALHEHATVASVAAQVATGETHPHVPDYIDFEGYRAHGGYRLLRECLEGQRQVQNVIKTLEDCAPSLNLALWPSTPTKASPAPSRTGTIWRPIPTGS